MIDSRAILHDYSSLLTILEREQGLLATVPYGVPELYAYKLQETLEAESLLLGRITY